VDNLIPHILDFYQKLDKMDYTFITQTNRVINKRSKFYLFNLNLYSMNIRPLGDRILVKPTKEEEITAAGIVLPATVDKEKKAEGEIVAVGNGEAISRLNLKVGDKVLYKKWGGEEIKVGAGSNEETYKILYVGSGEDKSDVVAKVE
jgi:chaperonin GroES